jgi:tRNA (guanine26-N2/guanine27-N2)-dimethyltransferase
MWLEPLHDVDFCNRILANVAKSPERSQTAARIRGMVGTAALELSQPLFYFIPAKIAGLLRAECPPMNNVVSALLHRGFQVSRSHCQPGSLKTNATRRQVFDVIRNWIEQGHPVKLEGIAESSPARQMVLKGKTEEFEVNVEGKGEHPKTKEVIHGGVSGGVRYQMNPTANWGPGTAAKG